MIARGAEDRSQESEDRKCIRISEDQGAGDQDIRKSGDARFSILDARFLRLCSGQAYWVLRESEEIKTAMGKASLLTVSCGWV
jgi:hypothetical protein